MKCIPVSVPGFSVLFTFPLERSLRTPRPVDRRVGVLSSVVDRDPESNRGTLEFEG